MSEANELNVMRDLVDTLKTKAKEVPYNSTKQCSIYPSIDTDFPSTGYTLQSLDPDSIYVLTANT